MQRFGACVRSFSPREFPDTPAFGNAADDEFTLRADFAEVNHEPDWR
jgi:hypothetical protein